jgi:hypothetical protein
VFAVSATLSMATVGSPARADPSKQQCVDDNVAGQELRRNGRFADATEHLQRCAALSCPAIVRDNCARRLTELQRAQPSLLFVVTDRSGADIIDVRIYLDGTLLTDRLDGAPIQVDPGAHVFTFEAANRPPVAESLLVREGEMARKERVVVGAPPISVAHNAPTFEATQVTPTPGPSAQQVVGLSFVGAGAMGMVIGTVFGLKAHSQWTDAKDICLGNIGACGDAPDAERHVSSARDAGYVSTVAFIAGGAFIVGGAFLYFTGRAAEDPHPGKVAIAARLERERVGVILKVAF